MGGLAWRHGVVEFNVGVMSPSNAVATIVRGRNRIGNKVQYAERFAREKNLSLVFATTC